MDTNAGPSESPVRDRPYACDQCEKAFGRLTHLRRHEQSHSQADNFHQCGVCQKTFARLDSLKRHGLTHQDPQRQGGVKVPKACVHCVAAKTKCTGENPCRRCESKSLQCQYQITTTVHGPTEFTSSVESPRIELSASNTINWIESSATEPALQRASEYTLPSARPHFALSSISGSALRSPGASLSPGIEIPFYDASTPLDSSIASGPLGRYAVREGSAHPPLPKRRRLTMNGSLSPPLNVQEDDVLSLSFPDIDVPAANRSYLEPDTYRAMTQGFQDACLGTYFRTRYDHERLPTLEALEYLVDEYFIRFHPLLPILHIPSLSLSDAHWMVALALAAVGAQTSSDQYVRAVGLSLLEFLRRMLVLMSNQDMYPGPGLSELERGQVQLLCMLCMIYSGNKRLSLEARKSRQDTRFCESVWKRSKFDNDVAGTPESSWARWVQCESTRRLGYTYWLLDAQFCYQFDLPTTMTLENATVPMPCQDALFEATTAIEWAELMETSQPMPSLMSAVESLYLRKYIVPSTGEFGRILLVHAICQRTWDVEKYARQPLSHHVPNIEAEDSATRSFQSGIQKWLPAVPLYVAWRNAACDCLDVLNWSANSAVSAASGSEHPTIAHIHLARIVLLVPFRSIYKYAEHLAATHQNPLTEDEALWAKEEIQRWVERDHYKARLAVIHAGVLFWHVEKYSVNGYYEAAAVYLSALTLWAYATFRPVKDFRDGDDSSSDSEDEHPLVINLDRPTDDELLQSFVKHGNRMKAFLTGVGNLHDTKAPLHVAVRGETLLKTLTYWGCARQYIDTLHHLARPLSNPLDT